MVRLADSVTPVRRGGKGVLAHVLEVASWAWGLAVRRASQLLARVVSNLTAPHAAKCGVLVVAITAALVDARPGTTARVLLSTWVAACLL